MISSPIRLIRTGRCTGGKVRGSLVKKCSPSISKVDSLSPTRSANRSLRDV
ncbi:hypothetical protein D3C85_1843360 [compost metagenome]